MSPHQRRYALTDLTSAPQAIACVNRPELDFLLMSSCATLLTGLNAAVRKLSSQLCSWGTPAAANCLLVYFRYIGTHTGASVHVRTNVYLLAFQPVLISFVSMERRNCAEATSFEQNEWWQLREGKA